MDFVSKFNENFEGMINDLIQVFPNDTEFRFYQMALKAGLMTDNSLVSKIFHEKASNMYEQILNRDEKFFLEKDYNELDDKKDAGAIVNKLKKCWSLLTDDNKDVICNYLRVLVVLNKKIYN